MQTRKYFKKLLFLFSHNMSRVQNHDLCRIIHQSVYVKYKSRKPDQNKEFQKEVTALEKEKKQK